MEYWIITPKRGGELMIAIRFIGLKKDFVVDEVLKAGFDLENESDLLENPDDNLTDMVFEKHIRDRTSRFLLRFKKP